MWGSWRRGRQGWRPAVRIRRGGRALRGLLPLGAVLRSPLLAIAGAGGVERAADDVVAHAWQVLYTAAAHQHDGMLLEIVAHPGDVRRHLHLAGETHPGHLAQR